MVNRQGLGILMSVVVLSLPVCADTSKDQYKRGVRAERQADYDAAYAYFKQAHTLTPNDAKYFAAYMRMRLTASKEHLRTGELLRNVGSLAEAMVEFQRAVQIDGSSFIAQQELRNTAEMIRRQERQKSVPKVEAPKAAEELAESVELKPLSNAAMTLHLTANADTLYKTIGKLAGINVIVASSRRRFGVPYCRTPF